MNAINDAIVNPGFMAVLVGAPVLTGIAAFVEKGSMRPWLLAALGANVATFFVTMAANVPLNDTLAAVDLATDNLRQAREDFETPWVAWNIVRTATSTAATALLVRASCRGSVGPRSCLDRRATSTREVTSSLWKMWRRCVSTVLQLTKSAARSGVGTPVHDEVGDLPLAVGQGRDSDGGHAWALRRWTC